MAVVVCMVERTLGIPDGGVSAILATAPFPFGTVRTDQ
jgi:hypothetical protein